VCKPHPEDIRNPDGEASSPILKQWQGWCPAANLWLWVRN
jgi:hypothetical protein